MLRSMILAAILFATPAMATVDPAVVVVLQSQRIGKFVHRAALARWEARKLENPTAADLKPFLVRAQTALAERLGYSERLFGDKNFNLADGRLVEITVREADDRVIYTYRPRTRR